MGIFSRETWRTQGGIRRLAMAPGTRGVLHATGTAHGYQIDVQVVQMSDGRVMWRSSTEMGVDGEPAFSDYPYPLPLDLADEFQRFAVVARIRYPVDPGRGRTGELTLAVGDRIAKLRCQPPLAEEPGDGSIADQLWRIIFPSPGESPDPVQMPTSANPSSPAS